MLKFWVGRQSRLKQWVLEEWLTHSALAEFSLAGQIRDADLIFLKDPGISDIFLVKVLAKKKPKVLLVSEPKVVWPQNYLPFVYNSFDLKVFRCRSEQNLMDDQGEFVTKDFMPGADNDVLGWQDRGDINTLMLLVQSTKA